ncbi:hypothetical protein PSAC2689_30058 [Paraburkholderia sacchari]
MKHRQDRPHNEGPPGGERVETMEKPWRTAWRGQMAASEAVRTTRLQADGPRRPHELNAYYPLKARHHAARVHL